MRATTVVRFVGLVLSGLFAGFLVGVLVLEASLRSYDADVYTQVRLVELDHLDTLASVTLLPAVLTTALLVWAGFRRRGTAWGLTVVALVLLLVAVVVSLTVNLPINADQADWHVAAPPADWADVRDRWQIAHLARTVAAVVAFGLLSAAALATRDPKQPSVLLGSTDETRVPVSRRAGLG
jgi:hypothetical protein